MSPTRGRGIVPSEGTGLFAAFGGGDFARCGVRDVPPPGGRGKRGYKTPAVSYTPSCDSP